MNRILRRFATVVAALVSLSTSAAPETQRVQSSIYLPDASAGQLDAAPSFKGTGVGQSERKIPALKVELSATREAGEPAKTGRVYDLPSPVMPADLHWEPVVGGAAARAKLTAKDAKALRLHLLIESGVSSLEIRVQGDRDPSPLGPIMGGTVDNAAWLPVTRGSEVVIEFFVPAAAAVPQIRIDRLNYIVVRGDEDGRLQSTGAAEKKEYDAACFAGYPDYREIRNGAAATALVEFIVGRDSFICSGTLLNDLGSTKTPWFATANHCINDQTVAGTMTFHWFFEAAACGGSAASSLYRQTTGGARLLWHDATYDASFLVLNQPPAPGVAFSGWNISTAVGDAVRGIHHPEGDHTMVSLGNVRELEIPVKSIKTGALLTLDSVRYYYGGIESGSSGSGLFDTANGQFYWKGTLFGGSPDDYQSAAYSPFRKYFANIRQYLETGAPTPATCTEISVYRYRNTQILGHFYTTSTTEGAALIAGGAPLQYEGVAFNACAGGSTASGIYPVYRFKHRIQPGVYFYSMLPQEIDSVRANLGSLLQEDGIAYYAFNGPAAGRLPVYRFRNGAVSGANFYTMLESEKATIIATVPGYPIEGVGFYGMAPR